MAFALRNKIEQTKQIMNLMDTFPFQSLQIRKKLAVRKESTERAQEEIQESADKRCHRKRKNF